MKVYVIKPPEKGEERKVCPNCKSVFGYFKEDIQAEPCEWGTLKTVLCPVCRKWSGAMA